MIVTPLTGACIEATYKNIHRAEAAIVRLYNEDEVRHAFPDALRRVKDGLVDGDPIRTSAELMNQQLECIRSRFCAPVE